ncbi:hypothetical protein PVAP13_3NG014600 [Panicum virgatum]|uniref:RING-type domain-containing protein n=1 Tax=Panicum virgatum TaxID=38727 RepID=A0A8T0U3Q5_PANVG|nr:hypothetical protein PVAP13_3NG014600 [Panicum virgatum]
MALVKNMLLAPLLAILFSAAAVYSYMDNRPASSHPHASESSSSRYQTFIVPCLSCRAPAPTPASHASSAPTRACSMASPPGSLTPSSRRWPRSRNAHVITKWNTYTGTSWEGGASGAGGGRLGGAKISLAVDGDYCKLIRFPWRHGARPAHGHGHRQELGRGGTRRRRRRLVWLQRQLHEATDLFDQGSDDGDLVEQITHRQVLEAMTLHLLAQALGLDIETIIACLQAAHDGGGRGFGAVPASAAAVASLEKQAFHGTEGCGGGGESECAICFEDFEDGEEVSVMPCSHGHEFHPICITKWLGRSNMCPLCRHQLPTGVDGH